MKPSTTVDSPTLEDHPVPTRLKLSALWASVMFMYIYVDFFSLYQPGTIDGILEGRVWTLDITPVWAFGALALMAIPILMVCVSLMAKAEFVRRASLIVGSLYALVSLANSVGESWAFYWLGSAVETALLLLIIRLAWTWQRSSTRAADQLSEVAPG